MIIINKFDVVLVDSKHASYLLPDFWQYITGEYYMCMVNHQIVESKVGKKIFNCIDMLKTVLGETSVSEMLKSTIKNNAAIN
jgi:hypothetical protein